MSLGTYSQISSIRAPTCILILILLMLLVLPAASIKNGKIAFSSSCDGNWEIYSMNADGTGQTRLTNSPNDDTNPAWSPNGMKIAFDSNRDGKFEIYVMYADGTGQTRFTNNPAWDNYEPAWSPDGTKIAFTRMASGTKNGDIYVMNADGTQQTPLTSPPGLNFNPAWGRVPETQAPTLQDLINKVDGLGLPKGVEQSLLSELNVAEKKIAVEQYTPARYTLNAFINEVNAQQGKALTPTQAEDLITSAQRIIDSLSGK